MVLTRNAAPTSLAALLALFSVMLAGCASPGPAAVNGDQPTSVVGIDDESKGRIDGSVLDEESLPVAGAQVGLQGPITLTAITDDTGDFTFLGLDAGDYLISVVRIGYEQHTQRVTVIEGEAQSLDVELVALPFSGPYPKLQQQQGYLQCTVRVSPGVPLIGVGDPGWYTGVNTCGVVCIAECVPLWPEDKFLLVWDVNWTGTQEVLLEMQWQSTQALGKTLSVSLEDVAHANDAPSYGRDAGPSPLSVHSNATTVQDVWTAHDLAACADPSEEEGCRYMTRVFASANLTGLAVPADPPEVPVFGAPSNRVDASWVMDQRFEQFFTSFHNTLKPDDYTALPS